jgi:predicted Zn-dependent peptidase
MRVSTEVPMKLRLTAPLAVLLLFSAVSSGAPPATPRWDISVTTKTLPNGLTLVVSEDHASPTFGLCIVYRIGFRLEPKGRTGFAHLFEHMMFEGTPVAPKGTFDRVIEGGGGVLNGSTRYDYTNYIAAAPVSALDAVLWLEADRMKALDFSEKNLKNQQEVVKEEIRVNVLNRPYGLFFWTDVAGKAFDRWENAHDGYGSFADLDAASLEDVESFFATYYGPDNAVLAIVGDVDTKDVVARVERYFGALPSRKAPTLPDLSEGPNTKERTLVQSDPLARVPALAIGWKMPKVRTRDYWAATVLADVLAGGEASRLYQGLVKGKELVLSVEGGIGWPLNRPWELNGPSLLTLLAIYKPTTTADAVTSAVDEEIGKIVRSGVAAEELARTKTKMVADLYGSLEQPLGRAVSLSLAQLFTGDAGSLNRVPAELEAVTSADLSRVAREWLTKPNRTVVDRRPAEKK